MDKIITVLGYKKFITEMSDAPDWLTCLINRDESIARDCANWLSTSKLKIISRQNNFHNKLTIADSTFSSSGNSYLSCNFTIFSTNFLVSNDTECIGSVFTIEYGDSNEENLTSGETGLESDDSDTRLTELHSNDEFVLAVISSDFSSRGGLYRCLAFRRASLALHCSSDSKPESGGRGI